MNTSNNSFDDPIRPIFDIIRETYNTFGYDEEDMMPELVPLELDVPSTSSSSTPLIPPKKYEFVTIQDITESITVENLERFMTDFHQTLLMLINMRRSCPDYQLKTLTWTDDNIPTCTINFHYVKSSTEQI